MSTHSRPSRQRTEVRQAHLLDAALTLAARCSPADITTTDLANAVGITQGAVFRHFASKEAIWLAVMGAVTEQLMTKLQAAALAAGAPLVSSATEPAMFCESLSVPIKPADRIQPTGSCEPAEPTEPSERNALRALEAVFMAHVAYVVAHPGVPRVIFQELQRPQDTALKASVRALMQQYRTLLMHLLQQAQKEQLIAPHADFTGACVLFIGSVQGLVMQALLLGNVAAMTDLAPGVFALYQRGLCASTATQRLEVTPIFDPARRTLKAAP
ncbi:TetR/AcrR family transcriptional regulator [Rhodoferax antarcticus]|uniref:TetR/AcrR family transcriptional regulator n=1 Tax=Rhodoferax antarcticus TaxID=81479 RepID=UPI0022257235|nr:TetR family transcriptional regulator [Rhodoferax antarcticus]MCW2314393.1 AcrR family transcriptional regulator [Rhodoferax antarcticus]